MAEYMQLDVVTPERSVLSRKVEELVAPGSIGEFGVLYGHTPFLTTLKAGQILARTEDREIYLAVSGGFAEVTGNRVIILAETADLADDIDLEETKKDLQLAQERLKGLDKEDPEYSKWADREARAQVKIRVFETASGR